MSGMLIEYQVKRDKDRKAKKAKEEAAKLAEVTPPVENTTGTTKPRGAKNGNGDKSKV